MPQEIRTSEKGILSRVCRGHVARKHLDYIWPLPELGENTFLFYLPALIFEKAMAPYASTSCLKIPGMEDALVMQSKGSKIRHN